MVLREVQDLNKKVSYLQRELDLKKTECSELREELRLFHLEKIENEGKTANNATQNIPDAEAVKQDPPIPPPTKSLLIGDSLIKRVENIPLTEDVSVQKISGAVVKDVKDKLHQSEQFKNVYILVGTNNCSDGNVDLDDFEELLSAASAKANGGGVFVSSIPPRTDNSETNRIIEDVNATLLTVCERKGHIYVDNNPSFHLANGDINVGFLESDGLHLNEAGTKQILSNMGLHIKMNTEKENRTASPSKDYIKKILF